MDIPERVELKLDLLVIYSLTFLLDKSGDLSHNSEYHGKDPGIFLICYQTGFRVNGA